MIRSAVLVSGKGTKLQSLLDSVFFGEIPELQLVAVISSDANAYALKRARNAGIETVVVEPAMFPNDTSYDMAIRNKLKDMDIELVINAGFYPGVGRETARSFHNKVIAVQPSLIPAFETLRGDAVHEAVLARGLKVTGATVHFVNEIPDGGEIILQKAVEIEEGDTPETLQRRRSTAACSLTRSGSCCLRRSSASAPGRSACTAVARSCSSEKINRYEAKTAPDRNWLGAVKLLEPARKCKADRAAGELKGARPASNPILLSVC